MVDFLYYGEANVNQESLDVFLALAEELRLKGLTGSSREGHAAVEEFLKNASIEEKKNRVKNTPDIPKPMKVYNSNVKTESSLVTLVSVEAHQLDEQIKSMMTITEKKMTRIRQKMGRGITPPNRHIYFPPCKYLEKSK